MTMADVLDFVSKIVLAIAVYFGLRAIAQSLRISESGLSLGKRAGDRSVTENVNGDVKENVRKPAQWASPKAEGMAVVPEAMEHSITAEVRESTLPSGADTLRRMKGK